MNTPYKLTEAESLQQAGYYMLADRLEVALSTRNLDAAVTCMRLSSKMYECRLINLIQYAELREDFSASYPHVGL